MTIWWVILAVAGAVLLLGLGIKLYWYLLLAFFPRKERATEVHTVVTRDMWELQVYRYRRGRTSGEPVLLLHGMGANHHNFTEPEGACLVDELMGRGYDCWAVDTRLCRSAKPAFERVRQAATIDDILLYDVPAVIRYIRKNTSYGRVHWVGHSLGGMLLYAYLLHWGPAFVASGTTLGSPIGFDGTKLKINLSHLDYLPKHSEKLANVFRAMIPVLFYTKMNSALFPMNARNLHANLGPANLFHIIEDPIHGAMKQLAVWAQQKTWTMLEGGLDVKAGLNALNLPLLTIFAARDPFVPVAQAKAFFEALPNADKQMILLSKEAGCANDYDHCDMAFGVDGPRMVYGPIAKWIESHPITERVRAEEVTEDDIPIRGLLDAGQRAEILSGQSFVHLKETAAAPAALAPKALEEAPTKVDTAMPPAPTEIVVEFAETEYEKSPLIAAPRKAVAKKKTTAKAKEKKKPVATKKPAAKVKVKAKTTPKPVAVKPAPKAKATATPAAKEKTTPKPAAKTPKLAAKPKPAPKSKTVPASKPAATKTAPAPKAKPAAAAKAAPAASSTPRVTLAPSKIEKHKPSRLTQSAILSAGDLLKNLDRKK